ncbi:signal peptide peptidase SppA [Photobacterium sanctipauli]|uniref:Signal peptide peptidase SppA n=1 Tax=Photobacterium sanctipauli TaxID=1342794 RepID=A0A2T3NXM6_9GAMM|nr:signal peptide peptidase SppA [Photobacterium sanctipauli]PSW21035.1 signal peptide peptidase SppA [Photobacterium sanctipauli]
MKVIFKGIAKLFRGIWKLISFTRQLIINLIFLLIVGVLIFAFTQSGEEPVVPDEAALVLDLSGPIVEQRNFVSPVDAITSNALGQPQVKENVLFDIVDTIRAASTDNRITGLVLNLRGMAETNLTKMRYIAKAIEEFKQAGKPVYAIGDNYKQSQYYLSTFADKVFMSPDGGVLLTGYGSYSLYYKSLLEKLDVNTHVFRVGTYKSFVEPYTLDGMSDEAREANTVWLNQLWQGYTSDVAANRQIDASVLTPELESFIEQLKAVNGDFAELSLKLGLVDELITRPALRKQLIDEFGSNGESSFNQISYYDYQPTVISTDLPSENQVAVVVASGAIVDGGQRKGTVSGDSTAALLREARLDDKVKSVILRVDSPGGSAFASEVIRNEVDALKHAGKPVVVSMSSLAASGGYWISSSADRILAQPTTITGSIGIFAILTTFEKGLEKMGIYSDGVGTTPFSGVGVTRELPEGVAQVFQLGIEHGYQRFIGLVSEYRNMSLEQADSIAQGRVWTGKDALKLGLVDELGDFDDAVNAAVELAQLDSYELRWMAEPLSTAEMFMQQFTSEARAFIASAILGDIPKSLQPVTQQVVTDLTALGNFDDPKGQYAFCINCINIEK